MKRKDIILIHLLYWFYIVNQSLFPMYVGKLEMAGAAGSQYIKEVIISLLLNAMSFYLIYFMFPRIITVRNRMTKSGAVLLLVTVVTVIRLPIDWYFWKSIVQLPARELVFEWIWVWNHLRLVIITGIYAVLIHYLIDAFEAQKLRHELLSQRQASELALLKSQVNPHFLFNTLNNIYSLVYHKSDEAPEAVMKFSSIMRYVLYDANAEKVLLEKEIEYLRSYVELQKLRVRQQGYVVLDIEGNTGGISIAPMLLIPFVENAFKHGSRQLLPGIVIRLAVADHLVRFEITNFIKKNPADEESHFSISGLTNIRRRLELIYPGKHRVEIKETPEQFQVILEIRL